MSERAAPKEAQRPRDFDDLHVFHTDSSDLGRELRHPL